jgi:hypothetical protein
LSLYFRIEFPQGADLHEVKTDSGGFYFGDRAHTSPQGSVWRIIKQFEARLSPNAASTSPVILIEDTNGTEAGVSQMLGSICETGTLRLARGQSSGADVTFAILPVELERLEASNDQIEIHILMVKRSVVSTLLTILEINGTEYEVNQIEELQGMETQQVEKGTAISVHMNLLT